MKGKILIVDDEKDLRDLLKSVVEADFTVTEADSGAALLKCFSQDAPDVVLLDLKLPDANGLDLLPQIKKTWPDTEVIVLTGEATFEAAVQATKRGAYHFINKPFDPRYCRSPSSARSKTGSKRRRTIPCAARSPP
jgi:DNA-binding NtrC family response regulator